MNFLKKNRSNVLFIILLFVLLLPQTRLPVMAFIQRAISFSPSQVAPEDRRTLTDYHWFLRTANNTQINFNQSENKVVLINFWATWCPPCVAEMHELQKLFDTYGNQVDFYFVTNDPPEKVTTFLTKNNYTFPVYFENSPAPKLLQTNSLPTTYLLSKKGEIVIQKTGAAKWNSKSVHQIIEKLLKE